MTWLINDYSRGDNNSIYHMRTVSSLAIFSTMLINARSIIPPNLITGSLTHPSKALNERDSFTLLQNDMSNVH